MGMTTKSLVSNVDLIRRFVFDHQPVSAEQIAAGLREQMVSIPSDEIALQRYVMPVLKAQSYYNESGGQWTVSLDRMPEYSVLSQVMNEEHRLLYERDVRSKVAAKLGMKVANVVLDLEQAPQMKRFGSMWGLVDWVLANDQAAEQLRLHPSGLSEKDLLKAVCDRHHLEPRNAILHLTGDKQKRFVLDRKLWHLRELYEKEKSSQQEQTLSLPQLKTKEIDRDLEGSFLEAQIFKAEDAHSGEDKAKARLKKVLRKQAQDIIEQRTAQVQRPDDLAARLSQELNAGGSDEYGLRSYQRVEATTKERGLAPKEREEIQQFVDGLLAQETVGVGASIASVANAPLSARKTVDVLRLKHLAYTRDRVAVPTEFNRLLVELLNPHANESVLHPSCYEGSLAVELFTHLFEGLEGAAWAFHENSNLLEIVQPDGARFTIDARDSALLETAKDKFMVSQTGILNHYLTSYRYTGIEPDRVLARAARVITRLSGYENVYISNRDYLSELPEVFGLPPDEDNDIPQRFDCILGNFTFTADANLAANYLDQSLRLLSPQGRLGVFVQTELLRLLKQHALLGEFLRSNAVTHFIQLPLIEGRDVVLLLMRAVDNTATAPKIIYAEVVDFKAANVLGGALQRGADEEPGLFKRIDQLALTTLID
jgi:hypothetical protein